MRRLTALLNILGILKVETVGADSRHCLDRCFELLNGVELNTIEDDEDTVSYETEYGTVYVSYWVANRIDLTFRGLEDSKKKLRAATARAAKKLKWITPLTNEGNECISGEEIQHLTCRRITNAKIHMSIIKLALMKANIEFVDTGKYIISKDCAFMAYKDEYIMLVFKD